MAGRRNTVRKSLEINFTADSASRLKLADGFEIKVLSAVFCDDLYMNRLQFVIVVYICTVHSNASSEVSPSASISTFFMVYGRPPKMFFSQRSPMP